MSNDGTPWASIGVHSGAVSRGIQAGRPGVGRPGDGEMLDEAANETTLSGCCGIIKQSRRHCVLKEGPSRKRVQLAQVMLWSWIMRSYAMPRSFTSSYSFISRSLPLAHHPPAPTIHPHPSTLSATMPLPPHPPPTIGGCGCRSALGPGPKGCATLRLMILHSDDQIRKRPTTAAAPPGKSDHCDFSSLVSYYPLVGA